MSDRFFYSAKVLDVIDGDTLDLVVDLGFDVHFRVRVRLHGINTPESRTSDKAEKELGLKAKAYTKDWTTRHSTVFVKTVKDKKEKFGRILAEIYSDELKTACLNEDIIEAGLARKYNGEARGGWFDTK
jgi:micrococcal nuclease